MLIKVINSNYENELFESSIVTFEGNSSPKFGWAIIMVGGTSSGKTTSISGRFSQTSGKQIQSPKILLRGKLLSIDALKEIYIYLQKLKNNKNIENDDELHNLVVDKGWIKKLRINFFKEQDKRKLPNVIFDMTSKDEKTLIITAKKLKKLGYKIALIWTVTNINIAYERNQNRKERVTPKEILFNNHLSIKKYIYDFIKTKASKYYNEIWILINSGSSGIKLTPDEQELINQMSCIQLRKSDNQFDISDKTVNFINSILSGNINNDSLNYLKDLKKKDIDKKRKQTRITK